MLCLLRPASGPSYPALCESLNRCPYYQMSYSASLQGNIMYCTGSQNSLGFLAQDLECRIATFPAPPPCAGLTPQIVSVPSTCVLVLPKSSLDVLNHQATEEHSQQFFRVSLQSNLSSQYGIAVLSYPNLTSLQSFSGGKNHLRSKILRN